MRPLRYSINVTLDGCCHQKAGLPPDEESMRFWTAELEQADALLFGRVTYEMMESAWRKPATGRWPDWMQERQFPFAGHGPTLLGGLRERLQLELVDRQEFRSGAVAQRYRPTGVPA